MFKVLVNYDFTPDKSWIGDDYLIYDRSDDGIDHLSGFDETKIVRTPNKGQVDYDKLTYLVENYDNLPDVFLWGKTNIWKYITPDEYEKIKDKESYTPLLTESHKTYSDRIGPVCFYSGGLYNERNDSWYVNELDYKYFCSFGEFALNFGIPNPPYIPFAPGGNYILTRDVVHKYSRDLYDNMRSLLPYSMNPAEAHMCERAYHLLWGK